MSQDFLLQVFFVNQFPPSPPVQYTGADLNFFKNSRRYIIRKSRHCFNYLPPVSLTPVANLPPVSLIAEVDGNFWKNLPPVSLTPGANLLPASTTLVANLPSVPLTPLVHIDLRISPRVFEKILICPNGILGGLGETDSRKKT